MAPPDSLTSLPAVESEFFAGPLDLLVAEVRRQNVAIESVAMAPLTARFLAYVASAPARNLNLDIEWLHLAATLIHWKSAALLPREDLAPAEAIRDEVLRLIQAHYKDAACELGRQASEEANRLSRPAQAPAGAPVLADEASGITVWDLVQQARELATWAERRRSDRRPSPEELGITSNEVTVAEMMNYLKAELIANGGDMDLVPLLERQPTLERRAGLFLGMLEMACANGLKLTQTDPFGPIIAQL